MVDQETSSGSVSEAAFYGLSEIPFEPTGSATSKYVYVAPKRFSVVEDAIADVVNQRKLYVLLFKAPQGGGKSATAQELKRRVGSHKYASGKGVLIINQLLNLDFASYAKDFLRDAKPLLPDLKWERYEQMTTAGELKNTVIYVLKTLGQNYSLVVWAIDEFDILVDYPREKQSEFLQAIREIIDDISNERLPILFLMSHTVKSSREFQNYLKEIHGPLQSRVVGTMDIGYVYSEVRNIVASRLGAVRTVPKPANSIEPFSEEALKELYNLIVTVGGTGELSDFRLFERCCYFTILQCARIRRVQITDEDVRAEFQKLLKDYAVPDTGEKLSLKARSERTTILASPQMVKNHAALKGLSVGLLLLKDQFSEITGIDTHYLQKIEPDIHISSMQFEAIHKPTGKQVSTMWILGTKEQGSVLQDDLRKINTVLTSEPTTNKNYANVHVLSYVSDMDLDSSQLVGCDIGIRISSEAFVDLIGMSVESVLPEDVNTLRKTFDVEVAPLVRQVFEDSTRDVTKPITPAVCRLIKVLNLSTAAGHRLTKEKLKEEDKKLYLIGTRVSDKIISDLVSLGFAKEEGTEVKPAVPKALSFFDSILRTEGSADVEVIRQQFRPNGDNIMNAALSLGIIETKEDKVVRVGDELRQKLPPLIEEAKRLLDQYPGSTLDTEKARDMIQVSEKATSDDILSLIAISSVLELLPDVCKRLKYGISGDQVRPPSLVEAPHGAKTVVPSTVVESTSTETQIALPMPVEVRKGQPQDLTTIVRDALSKGPMTLEELRGLLRTKGVSGDLNNKIIGMVIRNELKLTSDAG